MTFRRRALPLQTEISHRRRHWVMAALALGGFGIGTTEFVSMGLLELIADDLSITENQAGHVISAYALGVVVGAPLITTLTGMMPRRRLALLLMAAFTLGNLMSAFADSYPVLLIARFIAGLPHGAFFSIASLSAASMAPAGERGKAVALTGLGLPVATVIGVPAAQTLGQQYGWNTAYLLVGALGLVTLATLWFLMPHMTKMAPTSPLTELGALGNAHVWLTLAVGSIGFGGMFAVYTYISWTMTHHAGLPQQWMWLVLMSYGLGMVCGNMVGGRLADRSVTQGILIALICIAISLVVFYYASAHPLLGGLAFGLVGFFGTTLVPCLQLRLMDVAGRAQTLASALNHSALNIANAAGAMLGGVVISRGYGYSAPALAGAAIAGVAIVLWLVGVKLLGRNQLNAAQAQ